MTEYICDTCNGSGEGMYDGSMCRVCRGSGVVSVEVDLELVESGDGDSELVEVNE